ncbi:MAG: hypothetical protein ABI367_02170 [Mucilaginibacter sp.]
MKKITITAVFNHWGHGYIDIVPAGYREWEANESSSREYNLASDDYTIVYNTVTGGGGSVIVTDETGATIGINELAQGMDQGNFRLSI